MSPRPRKHGSTEKLNDSAPAIQNLTFIPSEKETSPFRISRSAERRVC
ncbi:hypothetical protein AVEN_147672-1, partial [Araneus ventricosus]